MKKVLKVLGILLTIVIAGIACLLLYVKTALPNVGKPADLTIQATPERLERGHYLALHVASCIVCHSRRDYTTFGAPVKEDSLGAGGERFGKAEGFPGNIYAPNLTSYSLGKWTDGELVRAITTGVSRDGHALFPIMNYPAFGKMDTEDIYSIVVYLRTLRPIQNDVLPTTLDFPVNFIVNTIPARATLAPKPDSANTVAYGKYLVDMASCIMCHSKDNKGKLIPGMEFGGGKPFDMGGGLMRYSANITPDKETGIGNWTKEMFIRKFKQYTDSSHTPLKVAPTATGTPMPWQSLAAMREQDLAAIYAYLQSVKPINNDIKQLPAQHP